MTTFDNMEGVTMDGVIEKQEQQQNGVGGDVDVKEEEEQRGEKRRRSGNTTADEDDNDNDDDVENNNDNDVEEEEEVIEEEIVHAYASPSNVVLQRDSLTAEAIEEEMASIQIMWEMAAILDFFHLFRKQLKLTRQFAASDLERVLVTSPGDTGLLADIHIDLMRGISPKNEISTTNWQIHLANKIKFHWRNLNDGTPCPFKPEKYLEAISYAELSAAYRVRALHFLCCIRLDREDIALRMYEAERPKTEAELAEIEAAQEAARLRASRSTRSSRVTLDDTVETELLDTLDTFRREPTGVDSTGAAYYYFDHMETTGFRVYKEILLDPVKSSQNLNKSGGDESDGDSESEEDLSPEELERRAAERAAAESKMGRKRRERALKKMPLVKSKYALRDHPKPKPWKLVATTLEELIALGESLAFGEAASEADKTLGQLFLEEFVPQLQEKAEAEERKRRAAERVRSRLGNAGEGGERGGSGNYYGRDSTGGAGGEGGDDGGGGDGNGAGYNASGRSRRARTQVNYAFNEYDNMLKTAIRRSQKGGRDDSPGWDEDGGGGGRRSRRGGSPPVILTGEEAAMLGLRRGRSHTAGGMYGVDSVPDLDERALRQQRAERNTGGGGGGSGMYRSDTDASLLETGMRGARGGSYETQSSGGGGGGVVGGSGGRRGSGGRSRLAPKYAKDYVTDVATEDSDGPSYVARPSKRRGRPPTGRAGKNSRDDDDYDNGEPTGGGGGGRGHNRSAAVEDILAKEQKQDEELMKQVATEQQQQQQQQQAQAVLAQRQQFVQRIQQIQMMQAQGLPIPPEQLQFLTVLGQYQQQRQQQQQQQGMAFPAAAGAGAPAIPMPAAGGGAVNFFPGATPAGAMNQFAGLPIMQQHRPVLPFMGAAAAATAATAGGMVPVTGAAPAPGAPGLPAMMPQVYQGPPATALQQCQQSVYFNQNVGAVVPQQQQQNQADGGVSLSSWGGSGKRTQPTSKRVPPPP
jgi:hypothetical protein